MPLIQSTKSVAAASVEDNILDGSQFEFLPYNAFLEFGLVGDANGADLAIDVYTGQDVLTENMKPSIKAAAPVYPDDFTLNDVAAAGERVKVRVRNTHATTARTIYFAVKITPI